MRRKMIEDRKWKEQAHKCGLSLEHQHFKSRFFLSTKRKEMKISEEENKHTNMPSTLNDQTFKWRPSLSMRKKHLTVPREESKYTNCGLDPEDQTFKSKVNPWRWRSNQWTYICSIATNIRDYTQILWNTKQISFVHKFVIIKFGTPCGTISTSHLFLQNQTSKSKQHLLQRSDGQQKKLPRKVQRRTPDPSLKDVAKLAPSPKDGAWNGNKKYGEGRKAGCHYNKTCSEKFLVGWTKPKAPQSCQLHFVK